MPIASVNRPFIGQWLKEMLSYVAEDKKDTFQRFLDFVEQSTVGEILANEGNSTWLGGGGATLIACDTVFHLKYFPNMFYPVGSDHCKR